MQLDSKGPLRAPNKLTLTAESAEDQLALRAFFARAMEIGPLGVTTIGGATVRHYRPAPALKDYITGIPVDHHGWLIPGELLPEFDGDRDVRMDPASFVAKWADYACHTSPLESLVHFDDV